ncbi:alpha-glucan phosphorylase [Paludibacter propionicigenes WB4]|uniref:Alpha-glucan phosphorylase n=1 Tax=Paludibacter propionicigenes (strain DSM 17365 / JCM 13257 / WB4) TaxID=694427 RepID=E4T0F4_PALPW|nr:alpha-glucan family phosphorylase [Paludibacter propionicigenes]ADQ78313.1 alpha-glucan phosphorylase [Paludibacter propionicigenes WB4]
MKIKVNNVNDVNLKEISVKSHLPASLNKLDEIAQNIWWTWNSHAKSLFRQIDKQAWIEASSNPVLLLNILNYEKLVALGQDAAFIKKVDAVYDDFQAYMNVPKNTKVPSIAYFSMEYGLTEVLKIYSGGLGVLAGDYLKEASDCNVDLTAVGFLYRYGYFTQSLSVDGQQVAVYEAQNFNNLPIQQLKDANDEPIVVEVPYPGRTVYSHVWKVSVGRIALYLLDTDNDMNSEYDRSITHQLYGGDWENRMKQEIMLGIGGILTLKKLGIEKEVYHCNEGHAALINTQRLVDLIADKNLTFNQALEIVRASSLYTVHTPVPAGHDSFEEGLFQKYMSEYPAKLQLSWDDFIDMGREHPGDHNEKFSMSTFACNTCQEVNGVSWLHGKVSQEMFNPIWKGYFPEELHVSYVTNGVHLPTWTSSDWKAIYEKYFTKAFYADQSNMKIWEGVYQIPDEEIWHTRMNLKIKLIDYIKDQFRENWLKNQGDPSRIVSVLEAINPKALIIGFGRRFATYKRAHLLFTDLERLEKIVNDPLHPVQFLFTGKAHPADGGGQGLIKRIIEISRMPQFLGKVIFLENYDMRLAKRLVCGVDIWLNTPTRPLEASGTSGEKAQMNGVLNFSVLDGWWLEGYVKGAGWALTEKRTYENDMHQDQLDAATIYSMLENEIIPLYFAKNTKGYSPEWIQVIKNSLAQITPRFTTKRMIDDYIARFYTKLATRSALLKTNDYAKAKEITAWKEKVAAGWDKIQIVSMDVPDKLIHNPQVGEINTIDIVIDVHEINDNGIGIELVATKLGKNNVDTLYNVEELKLVKTEGTKLFFSIEYQLNMAGSFKYGFRMFPKNEDLPHRQDFCYVRWI